VFEVRPDGTLANRQVFNKNSGFLDGIKIDTNGNLFAATSYSILKIYSNTGMPIGDIITPGMTTSNCAFGGPNNKTLFITGEKSVYRIKLK
jgi:gluconolactonase